MDGAKFIAIYCVVFIVFTSVAILFGYATTPPTFLTGETPPTASVLTILGDLLSFLGNLFTFNIPFIPNSLWFIRALIVVPFWFGMIYLIADVVFW